jgi:hypothetical protein
MIEVLFNKRIVIGDIFLHFYLFHESIQRFSFLDSTPPAAVREYFFMLLQAVPPHDL